MKPCYSILLLIVMFSVRSLQAQSPSDELEAKLKVTPRSIEYVDILNELAIQYANADLEKAELYSSRALAIADSLQYKKGLADAYSSKSFRPRQAANYSEELEYQLMAARLYEELGDLKSLGRSFTTIGQIHFQQRDAKLSKLYYEKAIDIFKHLGDSTGEVIALRRIGNNYQFLLNNNDSALVFYSASLAIAEKVDDKNSIGNALNNIGWVNYEKGNYEVALTYYARSLEFFQQANNTTRLPAAYHNIGRVYLAQNRLVEATTAAQKSLDLSKTQKNIESLIEANLLLSEIFLKQNNYKNAFHFLNEHRMLKDSLRDQETSIKIAQMEAFIGRKKIDLLEREKIASAFENQLANSRFSIAFLVICLILAVSALVIIVLHLKTLRSEKKVRGKELELAESQRKSTNYKLAAIRSQMNPHFIFNSLNSIQNSIISSDNTTAYTYLNKFSKLLRGVLLHSDSERITLQEEIRMIELYLDMQKLRFKDQFSSIISIEEGINTSNIEITPMLVQPFIENSMIHGLPPKQGEKKLFVGISQKDDNLCFIIEDNGIGRRQVPDSSSYISKGIELVRSSLFEHDSLEIVDLFDENNQPSGTRVILSVKKVFRV